MLQFGERADQFKRDYFKLPPVDVEIDIVEEGLFFAIVGTLIERLKLFTEKV